MQIKLIIIYLVLFIIYIVSNLVFGVEKISQAKKDQFNGGYCGASFKAIYDPKCNVKYGFEEWSLLSSFLLLALIIGFIHAFLPINLIQNFKYSILFILLSSIILNITTHLFNIPTLYNHFTEGYKYFVFPKDLSSKIITLSSFEIYGIIMINFFYLIAFIIFVMVGNVIGYFVFNVIKLLKKLL